MKFFNIHRLAAIVVKEFIQMRRDRLTFGMMVGVPLIQLTLFGFAINSNPKNLPTAVVLGDSGPYVQTLLFGMETAGIFRFANGSTSRRHARRSSLAACSSSSRFLRNFPARSCAATGQRS